MEVIDMSMIRKRNRFLLGAAQRIFGEEAFLINTVSLDKASEIKNRDGQVIAYGWVDRDGKPEFKPWCVETAN